MCLDLDSLAQGLLRAMFLCNVKQIVAAAQVRPVLQTQAVIVCLFGAPSLPVANFPFLAKFKPYGYSGRDFLQALSSYWQY